MTTSRNTLLVKRLHIAAVVICTLVWAGYGSAVHPAGHNAVSTADDNAIRRAFNSRSSDVQVEGEGVVTRLLEDDLEGGRHQRFIVRLASGQTILIAHNIDIAPRVDGLHKGDSISFNGEYVWNRLGGTVHWTHHDPNGRHSAGWLKHDGRTYQ
jgi:hypothetical protein